MAEEMHDLIPWLYDLILWTLSVLVDLFFREVHPRGSWKIPRRGPVMFVAAPHANQFVDSLVLMRILRMEAHRRVSNIIAAASMQRKFIGTAAGWMGSIPVARAMDLKKPGTGRVYMPDPTGDPLLIRGVDTDFEKQAQIGGLLVLPTMNKATPSTEILEIVSPTELKLKKEFKGEDAFNMLTGKDSMGDSKAEKGQSFGGVSYKLAPKLDQSKVYDAVFKRLQKGGCIGIFPEGGSHDRTELLPLKAGVAIMAPGSLAANPNSGLKIVCCGMNYFHAHKFRSRAVVEFSNPIEVPRELVEMYRKGERREATRQLLEIIYNGLIGVTVQSPDYETLMMIQAVRRLYKPKGKKLALPVIVELNRRLVQGYQHYKDDPRIIDLKAAVVAYNRQLRFLGIRDHQVEYAKFSVPRVILTLFYRVGKIILLSIGTLPGLVLFAPVFVVTKRISIVKSRQALANSTVKLAGRDVMATWKLLVALAFAPLLYTFYTVLLTYWTYKNRIQGYVPNWVPLWLIVALGYIIFPTMTFAALRIGEIGMDIIKSIRPLILSINPSAGNTFVRLRETRERLSVQVTEIINTLGPELFDDFERARLIADPQKGRPSTPHADAGTTSGFAFFASPPRSGAATPSSGKHSRNISEDKAGRPDSQHQQRPQHLRRHSTAEQLGLTAHEALPRNESFGHLGNLGLFSTRPPSRQHSRSSSIGPGATDGLTMTPQIAPEEISRRIRGAMQERHEQREKERKEENGWEFAGSEEGSEGEEGKKNL